MSKRSLRIWIDLANSPHVLFFAPIIRALEQRGHSVAVTARSFANTLPLVRAFEVRASTIGAGHDESRNQLLKQAYHLARTLQLMAFARGRFDVAASHLSHTQASAARKLGIPTFGATDYEHRPLRAFRHARCMMVPAPIPLSSLERWGIPPAVVRPYDGLKEHVYLDGFQPVIDLRQRLGISKQQLLVTFRPIAHHTNYSDGDGPASTHTDRDGQALQRTLLEGLAAQKGVCILVLPRTEQQRKEFERLALELPAVRVSRAAVDGPSLIFASDLVITGGGTMLREAAVLGTPAVSFFAGPLGAVDAWLASEGRVTLVRTADDLHRIRLARHVPKSPVGLSRVVLPQIVQGICDTAEQR